LLARAIAKNTACRPCAISGNRNPMYGKTHTKETLALMSKNSIGTNVGEKSGLYGKFGKDHPGFGRKMSAKDKQETSARFKGIPKSDEHKRKLRLAQINNIQRKYGQNFPNYNETSCIAFDRLNSELSLNGQHAENGGEFYIKQLGYWVDFYVPELNLVIE